MVLLVDNYDSFSYNLYQQIGMFDEDIVVARNDKITVDEIRKMNPNHIVLSPGAGKPENTHVCIDILKELQGIIPVFGVCLGHQTICEVFGMTVSYAKELMHGKTSEIRLMDPVMFRGLPERVQVARYHSLSAVKETLNENIVVTGETDEGEIMAVRHKIHPIFGVQFHPESILTPEGNQMMKNFLEVKV